MKLARLFLTAVLAAFAVVAFAQNKGGTVLPSTAQTATTINSSDFVNGAGRSGVLMINVTSRTSGTYTFTIQGKDGASGVYYNVLASTAIAATGMTTLKVGPALPVSANASANDVWPMVWRVAIAGASTPVMTFSVGYFIVQ